MAPPFDLIVITDQGPALVERLARALARVPRGRVAIQLREPQRSPGELFSMACQLRALTRAQGAFLLVNDRLDVALAADADGVQLPERGLPPEAARALLGPDRWLGVSRHDGPGLARSRAADFITLSPIHHVPGKGTPLGIAGFRELARRSPVPLFALGGVRAPDVPALLEAGAHGIAVIREVLAAPDPSEAVSSLLAMLSRPPRA